MIKPLTTTSESAVSSAPVSTQERRVKHKRFNRFNQMKAFAKGDLTNA